MSYEQWCHSQLTEAKVLSYLRRTLKKQNQKPEHDNNYACKTGKSFCLQRLQ